MSSQLDKQTKPTIDKRWEKIEEEFHKNWHGKWLYLEGIYRKRRPDEILSFFKSKFSLLEEELFEEIRGEIKKLYVRQKKYKVYDKGIRAVLKLQSLKRRKK